MAKRVNFAELKAFLDKKVEAFNNAEFIVHDPIVIPHRFTKKQDIEIAGFFAATFAWGQRVTIIRKCSELLERMDNDPHRFILQHRESDLKPFLTFRHRTFNDVDALYFISFFKWFYQNHSSLEEAFIGDGQNLTMENSLVRFHDLFFSLENFPPRTRKHIATPARNSTCKRLNMFLRWMVRRDGQGVDFGMWNKISPADLICPCDLHVDRVGRQLGLIKRKQTDWLTALELTENLKKLDPLDPVKYDFALFGIGVTGRHKDSGS